MCVVGVACGNDVCTNGEACNNGVCEPESTGGDAAAGQAVFSANCQACHAADGSGGIGPDIRDFTAQEVQDGFNSAAIHSSLTVTLTAQDFADISAFLDTSASS
ncbi:MAG: c-type cytochrome [Phycisphaerales bacterium]|nr:c-type cytochrome [Phycisphaerales bacterium]